MAMLELYVAHRECGSEEESPVEVNGEGTVDDAMQEIKKRLNIEVVCLCFGGKQLCGTDLLADTGVTSGSKVTILNEAVWTLDDTRGTGLEMDIATGTVSNVAHGYHAAVLCSRLSNRVGTGTFVWSVLLNGNLNGSSVGVTLSDAVVPLEDQLYNSECMLFTNHGNLCYPRKLGWGCKVVHGSLTGWSRGPVVVTCYLSMIDRTLSFAVNGTTYTEHFAGIGEGPWTPIVGLYSCGSTAVVRHGELSSPAEF
eukprot:Sspe_Gene.61052::Locus_33774_Transcript_1_1_Confidence_1.000_Length_924::g.61052::m.61052